MNLSQLNNVIPLRQPHFTNKFELRDYQKDIIEHTHSVIRKGESSILIQAPTGSGKSVILCQILKPFFDSGKRIIIFAHKIELIEQMQRHCEQHFGYKPTILANSSNYLYDPSAQVVIASIQAWSYRYKKMRDLPTADIVAVDEAHHICSNSYVKMFVYYEKSIRLGITATPLRLDNKGLRYLRPDIKGFEYLVKGAPVNELIEKGYLAPFKLFAANKLIEPIDDVKITLGDYNIKALAEYVGVNVTPADVYETWCQFAFNKKTVLYPVSVELSKKYIEEFNARGIPSSHIDAKTPRMERRDILDKFANGDILVLGQHSIVIEGIDVPDIEAVQFIRPTFSTTVWFQSIGRALRPAPNKEFAIIIDHTTTHKHLKLPDYPIQWSLDPISYEGGLQSLYCPYPKCGYRWRPRKDIELKNFIYYGTNISGKYGKIDPCHCPKCNHESVQQWTLEDDYVVGSGLGEKSIIEAKGTIEEKNLYEPSEHIVALIDKLVDQAKVSKYKKGWIAYKALEIKGIDYPDLLYLANLLGYKKSWANYKYDELYGEK
jgi:superfamily II DNA or RNA helicase